MYGIINICLKDLVAEKYGEAAWDKIRQIAGVDDTFVNYESSSDLVTYKLIGAAAELLGCTNDDVCELFGVFWVVWCMRSGYDSLFRTLGGSLVDFLGNLDFLHSVYMKTMYPDMTVPSFRVEEKDEANFILHYYSRRKKLGGIVLGIVKGVARIIFNTEIRMYTVDYKELTIMGKETDYYQFLINFVKFNLPSMGSGGTVSKEEFESVLKGYCPAHTRHQSPVNTPATANHPELEARLSGKSGRTTSPSRICPRDVPAISMPCLNAIRSFTSSPVEGAILANGDAIHEKCHDRANIPDRILVDGLTFCKAFPYHVVFDSRLRIKHAGLKLQQFCPLVKKNVTRLDDVMCLNHPEIELTAANLCLFIDMIFMVTLKQEKLVKKLRKKQTLILRGQMIRMEKTGLFLFLCSPKLTSLADLHGRQMHFSDLAPHDVTRDLILFNQQRMAEVELAKELEQKKEELRTLMRDLAQEKQKTDSLLFSMLPKEVANDLREGRHVQAGEFPEVTVLFSDIVKFTDMCSKCQPIEIVHFLNDMYVEFDKLTTVNNVYKVETIGDAYMVVGGLPVFSKAHAERVVRFGLDTLDVVNHLKSPVDRQSIQIRIGVHSGPVVAGVVGLKMPRYCLFGDTVNTASRMESHGSAGRVHASEAVVRLIKDHSDKFHTEVRGDMLIKGKGNMKTYFIFCRDDSKAVKTAVINPMLPSTAVPEARANDDGLRTENSPELQNVESGISRREHARHPVRRRAQSDLVADHPDDHSTPGATAKNMMTFHFTPKPGSRTSSSVCSLS